MMRFAGFRNEGGDLSLGVLVDQTWQRGNDETHWVMRSRDFMLQPRKLFLSFPSFAVWGSIGLYGDFLLPCDITLGAM